MPKIHAVIALVLSLLAAHAQQPPSKPLPAPKAGAGPLYERLDAAKTGVAFSNRIVAEHPMNRLYASSMCVGGVAVGDVNNDGLLDLYFTSGPEKNRLFVAKAPFVWADATPAPLDGGDAWGVGCSMADVDGDGDLDIYVCNYESPNQLFINALVPSGKLTFTEKAKEFGIATVDAGHTPAFCDYDRDGDLDLYMMANLLYLEEGSRPLNPNAIVEMENGIPVVSEKYRRFLKISAIRQNPAGGVSVDWDKRGRPHFLFRNEGGAFTNVTEEAGINPDGGMGLAATWWDYNQDGWPDLYVACDFDDPDRFYRNNGDGTFTDVVKTIVPGTPWFSMGADFGDLNGDGRPDFIASDMLGSTHFKRKTSTDMIAGKSEFLKSANPRQFMRNALYLNTATDRFIECAQLAGLDRTDWTWTVRIADYDNDGLNDVFFTNGMSRNYNDSDNPAALAFRPGETEWARHSRAGTPPLKERNFAYANRGDMRFDEVGKAWGLDHEGMSFAAATADFDKDGNLDLVVVNLDEPVFIYRNTGNANHRALVQLVSRMGDRRGIGAQVSASTDENYITSEVTLTRGYMACNEPLVHLGLGKATKIRRLNVRWPSGRVQWFDDLDADRHYTITEPGGAPPAVQPPGKLPASFAAHPLGVKARHKEIPFDDFNREPLLPKKLSVAGPGIAVADVDGDGRDDFYLGGAKGQAGQLFRSVGGGKFAAMPAPAFEDDLRCEDMGAVFFDADGDGDADLYVVSGGVEVESHDSAMQDRLYVNDGKGGFTRDADALPGDAESGSCVCAADFDRDGDVDLFVGGRVNIGAYPEGPGGRLLVNGGKGKFSTLANPALAKLGMVTGAVWSDADNDGWLDLLIVGEWSSPRFFKNTKGKLADATDTGTAKLTGWWNGITAADLDADGDMDYVVTNFGRNTKYRASAAGPLRIYRGDFEGRGAAQLVEGEYENNTLLPVRGLSAIVRAMPFIEDKFPTFKQYAAASLADIYGAEKLKAAAAYECSELNTGILRNDGRGVFKFEPLPWLAQVAPCFGSAVSTQDTIVLAQNFRGTPIESGEMAGGLSLALARNGAAWTHLWPPQSGIAIPEDARGVATIALDGTPAIIFGINNGEARAFVALEEPSQTSSPKAAARFWGDVTTISGPVAPQKPLTDALVIRLAGPAIGARVELGKQAAEIAAGSGSLSQNSATLFFKKLTAPATLTVRWPEGKITTMKIAAGEKAVTVKR